MIKGLKELPNWQLRTENVTGLHNKVWGDFREVWGDVSNIRGEVSYWLSGEVHDDLTGDVTYITGNVSRLDGDVTNLKKNVSNIWGNVDELAGSLADCTGDVSHIFGSVDMMYGFVSNIQGDVTDITGDVTMLRGDITFIEGDVTGIYGDATNLSGNIDNCEITVAERNQGVNIRSLLREKAPVTEEQKAPETVTKCHGSELTDSELSDIWDKKKEPVCDCCGIKVEQRHDVINVHGVDEISFCRNCYGEVVYLLNNPHIKKPNVEKSIVDYVKKYNDKKLERKAK